MTKLAVAAAVAAFALAACGDSKPPAKAETKTTPPPATSSPSTPPPSSPAPSTDAKKDEKK